jgi:hypothetical protein
VKLKPSRRDESNPLEWIETATHLLRSAPPGALLCYYFGSIPCLLGMLYFWTDMSRGAFAAGHLLESSLSAGALYLWMKCWQAVFLSKLRAHLLLEPEAPWTAARIAQMVAAQAAYQPIGLFIRFIAANIIIPYTWTYSVFVNAAILGDGTHASLRDIGRDALREAKVWWRQTYLAALCLRGVSLVILLDIIIVSAFIPFALRTFLGIETPVTRDWLTMFNSTFFAAAFALGYLCFDPLRKAVFVVRHFEITSIRSGEDLRVALKSLASRSRLAVAALVFLGAMCLSPLTPCRAAEPAPQKVESSQLSDSLDHVLERREYAWRFPREKVDSSAQGGWLSGFFENLQKTTLRWWRNTKDFFDRWMRKLFSSKEETTDTHSFNIDWSVMAYMALIVLILGLVGALFFLYWRSRKSKAGTVTASPVQAVPNLNEESVTADQLPEDGWIALGRELIARGDLRLALRAFYLATLAHLGGRDLIRLARHKSNHDYDRELQRRARGNDGLLAAFDQTLVVFERGWYGDHEITAANLDGVEQNMERIRAC